MISPLPRTEGVPAPPSINCYLEVTGCAHHCVVSWLGDTVICRQVAKAWLFGHVATATTDHSAVIKNSSKYAISLEVIIPINPSEICFNLPLTIQGTGKGIQDELM